MSDVGVVIAACDPGGALPWTLERLTALPERPPVLVVDNGSRRDIAGAVRAAGHTTVDVLTLADDHGPAARTIGARALSTELVAFCDDDSWFAPGALRRAAERFARDTALAVLQARVLVGAEERLDPICAQAADAPVLLGFVACGAVVRRRALLQVGGFARAGGFGGEERPVALDLAAAGWRLAYDPRVVAHHHPQPSARRDGRRRRAAANDLFTAWSRLRWRAAVRATATTLRDDPSAVAAALPRLPRALRDRRPIPPLVAAALEAIERHERATSSEERLR